MCVCVCLYSSNAKYGSRISRETPCLSERERERERERGHRSDYLNRKRETRMRSVVVLEKRARANDIPAIGSSC